jgi:hypothetical protein
VYSHRPGVCRVYPSLGEPGFVSRLDRVFANCSVCLIVYNVYHRVKWDILDHLQSAVSPSG